MYTVHGQDGTLLMQSARLNGKRITKKDVMQNAECNLHHGKNRP